MSALASSDSLPRPHGSDPDAGIIQAIAAGSADALGRLYDRHAGIVYGLARRIVSRIEDAEEVVQDVFAQVWRQAAHYQDSRASVAGWLVMLTRTRAIDRLRAQRARPDDDRPATSVLATTLVSADPNPEIMAVTADNARRVRDAFAGLPDSMRQVLELAYYQGLSHSEIAASTGLPLGTVKTRIRSAMDTLRRQMDVSS